MSKTAKIKIAIADDQELIRKALISLIEEDPDIKVIGEADNGKSMLELLKKIRPDIILLDVEMGIMNGRECLEIIKKRFPAIKVIILSMHDEPPIMADFISRGANAYLPKGCDADKLFTAIRSVHKEGSYFDNTISMALLTSLLKEKSINPLFDELALSKREIEILRELCEGKTNKEIAHTLNISTSTVDFHRGNIYRKTKSRNVTDLIKYAIKYGIVTLL